MKSSAKERKWKGQRCLIVDGYNVIAKKAGAPLSKIPDLEEARRELEDELAEYRAVYDEHVVVVYDAHLREGVGVLEERSKIQIVFTDSGETADARIERLVYDLRDNFRNITAELLVRLGAMQEYVARQTNRQNTKSRSTLADSLKGDVIKALEKWRRN